MVRFCDFEELIRRLILNNQAHFAIDFALFFLNGCKREKLYDISCCALSATIQEDSYFNEQNENTRDPKVFITKQLMTLMKVYHWEGFHQNFEKVLKNMRNIFGFPLTALKKLHSAFI